MKKIVFLSLVALCLPWGLMAQGVVDDLYYVPSKKDKVEQKNDTRETVVVTDADQVVVKSRSPQTVRATAGTTTVVVRDTEVASSADANYTFIPKDYTVPADADYFHITTNNTIFGTELKADPDVNVPLVGDMSSDIFSRPVDVSKYICIYGGAQKNLAPSGVTFVIVKEDALGRVSRTIPTMLNYKTHVDAGTMFNTPPVVPIYAALQTLRWIKAQGGIAEMDRRANERAELLYGEIDRNKLFQGTAVQEDRSRMNICFVMAPEYKELEAEFLAFATAQGMVGIKGHRSVGGFRASCYNAMPLSSVQALVECMQEFERKH